MTGPGLLKVSEDDSYGSCIGLRCRASQSCQTADDMLHNLFGSRSSDTGSSVGWALIRPSIASGAPNHCWGLKVLASLQVILGQFLHEEA